MITSKIKGYEYRYQHLCNRRNVSVRIILHDIHGYCQGYGPGTYGYQSCLKLFPYYYSVGLVLGQTYAQLSFMVSS